MAAPPATLRFLRRFFVPDFVLLFAELVAIGYPLYDCYALDDAQRRLFVRLAPAIAAAAYAVWHGALAWWRAPIARAVKRRAAGQVLDAETRAAAYRAMHALPRRAIALRTALWTTAGGTIALALVTRGLGLEAAATITVICASHSFGVGAFRALWYAAVLERTRAALLPDVDHLRRFADDYWPKLVRASLAAGTLGIVAIGTFTWFFIPITLEHYLKFELYFPITAFALLGIWYLWARRLPARIRTYLRAALSTVAAEQPARQDPRALEAYVVAQALPYQLALAKVGFWIAGEILLVMQGVLFFGVDLENAVMLGGEAVVVTIGVALYEGLWHRYTMRPLLTHIAARHRPPPHQARTPLSLRAKMLAGFGALTVFACGLSLFWSFTQYKTLATVFIQRESQLRLEALVADLQARAGAQGGQLERGQILTTLEATANQFAPPESVHDHAVLYYLPASTSADARPIPVGGGRLGPPPLPPTAEQLIRRRESGHVELSGLKLTGSYARLARDGDPELGSVALLLPGYRGRGPSTVPQIRVLVSFFVVLLIASLGLVVLIAKDLAGPIRELEQRAVQMAAGDLNRPVVTSASEGDEVGRLTFAFEEMRRELNDKLRSSTEINLSLEAEVTRRTAELERRNRELADALEQLQRAQAELVRSEKMASMGRLVAGIAHEINNPVNAVVNTVAPLADALNELQTKKAAGGQIEDLDKMIQVIQHGARRTKEIVQALHNYSRGDDDRVVDVDLQRSIDESLDLLRHHLKNGIRVEREYGDVGRIRGRTALNQVFMNLLTNAAQALGAKMETTGAGGTIKIKTARSDGKVVITVTDDGPGIPPEVLPRIFDPFFTTKDVGQGSGLGLSIVHGIVERHGGTIAVDSRVGSGTTFTITLPVAAPS
jgi:signal transduction histidine kinase